MRALWALALLVALAAASSPAQTVLRYGASGEGDLRTRWAWAAAEAAKRGTGEYHIGYSIVKIMEENATIGTYYSDTRRNHPSMAELIGGGDAPHSTTPMLRSTRLVPKEIAVIFAIPAAPGGAARVRSVTCSSMSLRCDIGEGPLYWLEGADNAESLALLKELYGRAGSAATKAEIVSAIGFHEPGERLFATLSGFLRDAPEEEVRARCAFALGEIHSGESLALLSGLVRDDRAEEVREQALFAISRMDSSRAIDALTAFARDRSLAPGTRSQAMFWLSQAAASAIPALRGIAEEQGEDAAVRRQALFALAQSEQGGLEAVIEIATGRGDSGLRRDAIEWLGQSDDPKALEALLKILRE